MAAPVVVPMSPGLTVADNYIIRVTAIDPSTGTEVVAVKVSNVVIMGNEVAAAEDDGVPEPETLANTATLLPGPA